ncbi:MAG: hypothetical protein P4M05_28080 [Bradyrhizobium sp.]|nr:hypothetical protein [Bradyrhizobium sp.]
MSAEIIEFSSARARRLIEKRRIEDLATSPLVVAVAVCCMPLCLAYLLALGASDALWRLRSWS